MLRRYCRKNSQRCAWMRCCCSIHCGSSVKLNGTTVTPNVWHSTSMSEFTCIPQRSGTTRLVPSKGSVREVTQHTA